MYAKVITRPSIALSRQIQEMYRFAFQNIAEESRRATQRLLTQHWYYHLQNLTDK